MRYSIRLICASLLAVGMSSVALSGPEQESHDRGARRGGRSHAPAASQQPTPPYHKSAKAAKPFPALVPAIRFRNYPMVARAYQIANEIPGVLAQQPCYCNCDKFFGHGSLLDCFASDHTAGCPICVKEAFLTDQMAKEGKKPAEVREAIIRGDWRNVDLHQPNH